MKLELSDNAAKDLTVIMDLALKTNGLQAFKLVSEIQPQLEKYLKTIGDGKDNGK